MFRRQQPHKRRKASSSKPRRAPLGRRCGFELLEDRSFLSVVTWDGGAGTANWHDAANWSGDVLPGANDDAELTDSAPGTVNLTGGTVTLNSLYVANSLAVSNANLSILGYCAIGVEFKVEYSTLGLGDSNSFSVLKLLNGSSINAITNQLTYIEVWEEAFIDATSKIDVSGLGHSGTDGPGRGNDGAAGGGGGFVGRGGDSSSATGGDSYDTIELTGSAHDEGWAFSLGSPGGADTGTVDSVGGAGGGSLYLWAYGKLTLLGRIEANGLDGVQGDAGGGSGGWIYIDADTFWGDGTVLANGGNGTANSGGGGGGAVVVSTNESFGGDYSGVISAKGGAGHMAGGAGLIFRNTASVPKEYLFDNGGISGARATTDVRFKASNEADVVVSGGAILSHPHQSATGLSIYASDILIASNGAIDVSGRGHAGTNGPGRGQDGPEAGGGGYGGVGGDGATAAGGGTYGLEKSPGDLGSPGGADTSIGNEPGKAGGGHIRIDAASLTIDGAVRADGRSTSTADEGAGSGGSIWITTTQLSGSGTITANGGNGTSSAGGGGGGRVGITIRESNSFPIEQISVAGGTNALGGGPGTLSFAINTTWTGAGDGTSWHDEANWSGNKLPGSQDDVVIGGTGDTPVVFSSGNVYVKSLAVTRPFTISGGSLTVLGDTTFSGGSLTVSGADTLLSFNGPTSVSSASLFANEGAVLRLPELVNYTNAKYEKTTFEADGPGSSIELPNLAAITGSRDYGQLVLSAKNGGEVLLPSLVESSQNISILASGEGAGGKVSLVDVSAATTLLGGGDLTSTIGVSDGGEIRVSDNLTSLDQFALSIGEGILNTAQLTSFTRGSITISQPDVDLRGLSSIDGVSIVVRNGVTLSLSQIETYTNSRTDSDYRPTTLQALGPDSRLELPNLVELYGTRSDKTIAVMADDGGVVDLRSLTTVNSGWVDFQARSNRSLVDLSSLANAATGKAANRGFSLEVSDNGEIRVNDRLTEFKQVDLSIYSNGILNTSQLTSLTEGSISIGGSFNGVSSNVDLSGVTTVDRTRISLGNGAKVTLSNLMNYTAPYFGGWGYKAISVWGEGTRLHLPSLPVLSGTAADKKLEISVEDGGELALSPSATELNFADLELRQGGVVSGGVLKLSGTSVLRGTGIVRANLENAGRVAPELGGGFAEIGHISVEGDYRQTAEGILSLELRYSDATQGFDRLSVSGPAELRGEMGIQLLGGFSPGLGATFPIITFASASGALDNIDSLSVAGDRKFLPRIESESFQLLVVSGNNQILFDEEVPGEIRVIGAADAYFFEGVANQTIFVDFLDVSGGSASVSLVKPGGGTIVVADGSTPDSLDLGPIELSEDGEYAIVIDGEGSDLPSYKFRLLSVPQPVENELLIGATAPGTIQSPGAAHHWTFTNDLAGRKVFVNFLKLDDGYLKARLLDINGQEVWSRSGSAANLMDFGPISLDLPVEYTLEIMGVGDDIPTYEFEWLAVPPPDKEDLGIADLRQGDIETPGAADHWRFLNDAAGRQMILDFSDLQGGTLSLRLMVGNDEVWSRSGSSESELNTGPITLGLADTYTLQITGVGDDTPTYKFQIVEYIADAGTTWDGGGDGTSWHDPLNWNGNAVPGEDDDVVINVGSDVTVTLASAVNVKSVTSNRPLSISAGSLTVRGDSTLSAGLTMTGGTLKATGTGTELEVTGTTLISNASLFAYAGATLALTALTSYTTTGSYASPTIQASGDGSCVDLRNVNVLQGATSISRINIAALDGGVVDLRSLPQIIHGPVSLTSDGPDSLIDLSALATFSTAQSTYESGLSASNNGAFLVSGSLTEFHRVELLIDDGVFPTAQLVTTTSGAIRVAQDGVDFSGLTNIDGTNLFASDGATLFLPNVTSYTTTGSYASPTIQASGDGSRVDLRNVNVLQGATSISRINIAALDGGVVDLRSLPQIIHGPVSLTSDGPDSLIDLSALATFSTAQSTYESGLAVANGGEVHLASSAVDLNRVDIVLESGGILRGGELRLAATIALSGSGTIAADVINSGQIRPGAISGSLPTTGILSISGDYTQTSAGSLSIEIGGPDAGSGYDQLQVSGSVGFGGTLGIAMLSYLPPLNSSFPIITFADASGAFDVADGLAAGSDRQFLPRLASNQYELLVVDGDNAIQIGDSRSGQIEAVGAADTWFFEGIVDQVVFLDFLALNGGDAAYSLFDFEGVLIASGIGGSADALDRGPIRLTTTGTYTLSIGGFGNSLPTYEFRLLAVPPPDSVTLELAVEVEGRIETPGATDHWTFANDVPGRVVFVDFTNLQGGTAKARLLDNLGLEVWSSAGSTANALDGGPFALDLAVEYTLEVTGAGDDTPEYRFKLWPVPAPLETSLDLGQAVEGTIASPGAAHHWLLDNQTVGRRVFVDFLDTDLPSRVMLLDANGAVLASYDGSSESALDRGPFTLDTIGMQRLIVTGVGDATPSYRLRMVEVAAQQDLESLEIGRIASGEIESIGSEDAWEFFNDQPGRQVFVDFQQLQGGQLSYSLVSLAGGEMHEFDVTDTRDVGASPLPLNLAGTYRLIVRGQGDDTPNYKLQLWDVPGTAVQTLELGDVVEGQISTPGVSRTYRFAAVPSQSVLIHVEAIGGESQLLEFVVRDAQGQPVFGRQAGSGSAGLPGDGRVLLVAGGEYTLTVLGVGDDVADYRLTLLDAPIVPGPISSNTVASGSIFSPDETHEWTFTLNEPRDVSLDLLGNVDGYHWQLISPSGRVLYDSSQPGAAGPWQASETGAYRLLVSGDGTASGAYQLRLTHSPATTSVGLGGTAQPSADIFLGTTPQSSQPAERQTAADSAARTVALISNTMASSETSAFDPTLLAQDGQGAVLSLPQLFRVGGDIATGEVRAGAAGPVPGRRRDTVETVADVTLMSYLADADQVHLAGIESGDEPPSRETARTVRVARSVMRPAEDIDQPASSEPEAAPEEPGTSSWWWLALAPLGLAVWFALRRANKVRRRALARRAAHQKLGAEWLPAPPPSRIEDPRS